MVSFQLRRFDVVKEDIFRVYGAEVWVESVNLKMNITLNYIDAI